MVHARTIGDTTFTFIVSGKLWRNSLIMQDKETGTRWTLAGRAVDGPLRGKQFHWTSSIQCRWYAWSSEYPETSVYESAK